jgi:hypothetical protein
MLKEKNLFILDTNYYSTDYQSQMAQRNIRQRIYPTIFFICQAETFSDNGRECYNEKIVGYMRYSLLLKKKIVPPISDKNTFSILTLENDV